MKSEPKRGVLFPIRNVLMDIISTKREIREEEKKKKTKRTQHAPSTAFRRFRLRFLPRFR